jgi:hypothetical protein
MKPVAETIAVIVLLSITGLMPAEKAISGTGNAGMTRLQTVSGDQRVSSTAFTGGDHRMVAGTTLLQR